MTTDVADTKTAENTTTTQAEGAKAEGAKVDVPADGAGKVAGDAIKPEGEVKDVKTEDKKESTILGDDKKSEPKKEDKSGAPEKYTDFTAPEGMVLDKEAMAKAAVTFKELGLSQEQAQKLVTLQAENAKALNDATLADYQKQVDGWKDSSTKLYGAKSGEQFAVAAQAINRFGTPELRAVLNETGLGNHPELVKFFVQVGHAIKEDSPADGRKVGEKLSDADVFFPSMKRK